MSARVIPWLNANKYRRYPFIENVQLKATPTLNMSDAVVVDFSATQYEINPLTLISVELLAPPVGPRSVTFCFQHLLDLYYVDVPETASFPYTVDFSRVNAFDARITFDVGALDLLNDNAVGLYTFDTPLSFEPALTSKQRNLRVFDILGTTVPESVTAAPALGYIAVHEGHNIQIALDPVTNTLTVSGILGAGAGILCDPPEGDILLCNGVFLRINGLHAGEAGDFQLIGGPGVEIVGDPDNHVVKLKSKRDITEVVCK